MTNGKSALIEGDYDKAINYFKLALEQKSGDNEATNLIDQLEILSGITKEQQDEDIDVYIHKLENIDNTLYICFYIECIYDHQLFHILKKQSVFALCFYFISHTLR